jgi:hypothetical protein
VGEGRLTDSIFYELLKTYGGYTDLTMPSTPGERAATWERLRDVLELSEAEEAYTKAVLLGPDDALSPPAIARSVSSVASAAAAAVREELTAARGGEEHDMWRDVPGDPDEG